MFFRPEEVHGASAVRQVFEPFPKRYRSVSDQTLGVGAPYDPIFHFHPNGRPAIQTKGINGHGLSFKEPADRQRFKPSLSKPLLLSLNRDPVLGGKVVERGEGNDVTGLRK